MSEASDRKRTSGGPRKQVGETGPNTSGCLNTEFTRARKAAYCTALEGEARGQREAAARIIGVHRATVTRHIQDDPRFASDVEGAMQAFRDGLIQEAYRRAVLGTRKPIYFQGVRAKDTLEDGTIVNAAITEYDTPLLILLLKRHCPEFKEKQVVENRNVNVDMGLADMEKMSAEQRAKLRELLEMEDKGEPE
jgi:hypothetical protein